MMIMRRNSSRPRPHQASSWWSRSIFVIAVSCTNVVHAAGSDSFFHTTSSLWGKNPATTAAADDETTSVFNTVLPPAKLILLDVDNTLYRDRDTASTTTGTTTTTIEGQIVQRIHSFCQSRCGLEPAEADQLHQIYGSTVEGLRQTLWETLPPDVLHDQMRDFYTSVYRDLDLSGLLLLDDASSIATGYSSPLQRALVHDILASATSTKFALASHSPRHHVQRVLHLLGLADVPLPIFTPDRPLRYEDTADTMYPTKFRPRLFFQALLPDNNDDDDTDDERFLSEADLCLIDDSATVLSKVARDTRMRTVHVHHDDDNSGAGRPRSLVEALAVALGWLDPSFSFSSVRYLQSKNVVDETSLNRATWHALLDGVAAHVAARQVARPLVVVDLGAGLLSMLEWILFGSGSSSSSSRGSGGGRGRRNKSDRDNNKEPLPSLVSLIHKVDLHAKVDQIDYYAYEPNQSDLEAPCRARLDAMGFVREEEQWYETRQGQRVKEVVYSREQLGKPPLFVHLRFWDFAVATYKVGGGSSTNAAAAAAVLNPHPSPDVVVGCCFADLVQPDVLRQALLDQFLSHPHRDQSHALVYFPITFTGVTQLQPAQPREECRSSVRGEAYPTPSDTTAMAVYARVLEERMGHNLNVAELLKQMERNGAEVVSQEQSDWEISPDTNLDMWRTMLYFFATGAAPALQKEGWNAHEWIKRTLSLKPTIKAYNSDLLFRVPFVGRWSPPQPNAVYDDRDEYEELVFTAPETVKIAEKERAPLAPDQVRIESVCSLISSGTELKVFKGNFEEAALDVNIESLKDERMAYPMSYGYSLVGRVSEVGSNVEEGSELLGKLVFAFAPHASQTVLSRRAIQIVPDDIDPFDAIFMPSVETAISIVHDANIRLGETVAVFGQGLIGLLIMALLREHDSMGGRITTFDMINDRLACSAMMGSTEALQPIDVAKAGPFDVAIEASGNHKALQAAIDHTRNNGRIIVSSWYGNADVQLKLGLDFHRSHKLIRTSQVSEIPAELSGLWTKERRFELCWGLVRKLKPSQLISKRVRLSEAEGAYKSLDRGEEVAIAFDYRG